jgi:hypothetical protein
MVAANTAIKALVRKVEMDAELSFREMVNTNWASVEHVGDHSGYVDEMVRSIKDAVSGIAAHGHLRERYIRTLCDRLVEWFGGRFIDGIISCRPICEAGAEQVLLWTLLIVDVIGCVYFETGITGVAGFEYGSTGSTTHTVPSTQTTDIDM